MREDHVLLFDSNRGVFIPMHFEEEMLHEAIQNVDAQDFESLAAGPDSEFYWEAWESVLNSAVVTMPETGKRYTLHQDGDLWMVPEDWTEDDWIQVFGE